MERGKTVLVVDDQADIVQLVKCMLVMEGYEVIEAGSGEDAVFVSEKFPFPIHLLVTDIRMSRNMGGCDLARSLRLVRPDLRVLYMSAFTEDPRVSSEVLAGIAGYLRKPFKRNDLVRKVHDILITEQANG